MEQIKKLAVGNSSTELLNLSVRGLEERVDPGDELTAREFDNVHF